MPGPPPISEELSELISSLQSHHVDFLVVGAHALAFHALSRFTEDLDLFVRRSKENAHQLRSALEEFGISMSDEAEARLANEPRGMIVLGKKPGQVDFLNFLDGVDFNDAWSRQVKGNLGPHEVGYLSLADYIATKRSSNRPKDIDDLNRLREQLGGELPGEL